MSKSIAGLKRIGYSDTSGGTITWVTGKVTADSELNPEVTTTETTSGVVSGGSSVTPSIMVLDRTNFDTLEGFSDNDVEKFWHLEFFDGREYVSRIPFNIQVTDMLLTNMRDGVSSFQIAAEQFHIVSNVFELKAT